MPDKNESDHKEIFGKLDKLSEDVVELVTTQKLTNSAIKENFSLINKKLDKQNGIVRELDTQVHQNCSDITHHKGEWKEHKKEHKELQRLVVGLSSIATMIGGTAVLVYNHILGGD